MHGSFQLAKAKLLVKGYSQYHNIDYIMGFDTINKAITTFAT